MAWCLFSEAFSSCFPCSCVMTTDWAFLFPEFFCSHCSTPLTSCLLVPPMLPAWLVAKQHFIKQVQETNLYRWNLYPTAQILHKLSLVFLILAILTGVRWYLRVVLIYISLKAKDMNISLSVFWLFEILLLRILFRSVPHYLIILFGILISKFLSSSTSNWLRQGQKMLWLTGLSS